MPEQSIGAEGAVPASLSLTGEASVSFAPFPPLASGLVPPASIPPVIGSSDASTSSPVASALGPGVLEPQPTSNPRTEAPNQRVYIGSSQRRVGRRRVNAAIASCLKHPLWRAPLHLRGWRAFLHDELKTDPEQVMGAARSLLNSLCLGCANRLDSLQRTRVMTWVRRF